MLVKVGDTWYGATPDQPIMTEMNDQDKNNLGCMGFDQKHYACFHADDARDQDQKLDWMKDKGENNDCINYIY